MRVLARRSVVPYAVAAALALGVSGCSGEDPGPQPSTSSPANGSPDRSTSATTDASPSATAGTSDDPSPVTAGTDLLAWTRVPGSVDDTVTVAGDWTLTVAADGGRARLDGPAPVTLDAGRRGRIGESFLDGDYALVVSHDRLEERPSTATVVELATGRRFVVDGRSDVPTTTGGTWAMGAGRAYHATYDGRAYCLAAVDLGAGSSEVTWCAPERQGFTNARTGPGGRLTVLTFDDSQPSCRTVADVTAAGALAPYPGVTDCSGWEGVALEGDARAWALIPKESRIESARVYAAVGDAFFDLGPATSGSLVACDDAAYFARDPGREGEPARVLRWTPGGALDVVYEAPAGQDGFVVSPLRCGGDHLTVTALTEGGDEQVTAPLG